MAPISKHIEPVPEQKKGRGQQPKTSLLVLVGLSRILCKRSPRVQTAETGMRRQRSDRCRLFSTITPTEPDVKGGEAGLLVAFID